MARRIPANVLAAQITVDNLGRVKRAKAASDLPDDVLHLVEAVQSHVL